jgi:tetratricopeptide (TPR) repeat protein
MALRRLAWFLATCPDARYRDAARAVSVAEKAAQVRDYFGFFLHSGVFHYTVGVCRYRKADYQGAREACQRGVDQRDLPYSRLDHAHIATEYDRYAGFFLAMSLWQLGEKDKARVAYDEALAWMQANAPDDKQILGFRDEARALLGIGDASK